MTRGLWIVAIGLATATVGVLVAFGIFALLGPEWAPQ